MMFLVSLITIFSFSHCSFNLNILFHSVNMHSFAFFSSFSIFLLHLRAILNKSWRQHPTKHQLYGHLPPITKTIQVRRTRHAGHCWRSKDELLWTPVYGQAKTGWPARTYIQQLCEDTGCSPEDLPEAMNDSEKWRERVRNIRASGTTWWWWFQLNNYYYSFLLYAFISMLIFSFYLFFTLVLFPLKTPMSEYLLPFIFFLLPSRLAL